MSHQPSPRQQAIYDAWQNENFNMLIQAVAGSGKTSTILGLIERTPGKTLYLAFNKSIKEETDEKFIQRGLEKRGKAMTLHSLGLSAIREFSLKTGVKTVVKNSKFYFLFKELDKEHPKLMKAAIANLHKQGVDKPNESLYMTFKDMNDFSRLFLTDKHLDLMNILTEMDKFPVENKYTKLLWLEFLTIRESSYQKPEVFIDFTDMIYIPVKFNLHIPIKPKYLAVDECQDLNLLQHKFIDNLIAQGDVQKWIAVGDRNQCQPFGTKILMSDLTEKNIEDLKIGDKVVSYDIKKCQFVGFGSAYNVQPMKVLNINKSHRVDNVFTVTLENNKTSSYTSNHKCYVQFNENKLKGKFCVYLMQKGVKFRVGISPCYSEFKTNAFGPVMRARAEKAEHLWVLKIFDTREEAYLHEQIISNRFKIPQMMFTLKNNSKMSQEHLDIFWYEMKDLTRQAKNVLDWFSRELQFPLWSNTNSSQGGTGSSWKLSSKALFKTQACNLLPEIMSLCVFDLNNKDSKGRINKKLEVIKKVEVSIEAQTFISLDIERNHNYVADGILTSNSIYGFTGAYPESFDKFLTKDNVKEFPLDVNYRCAKGIVEQSNKVYDVMVAHKTEPGTVVNFNLGKFDTLAPTEEQDNFLKKTFADSSKYKDTLVICRNKKPLFNFYFTLLERDVPVQIMGEDILASVIKLIKPYKQVDIRRIDEIVSQEIAEFEEKATTNEEQAKLFYMKETYANFYIVANKLCTPYQKGEDLIASFEKLFEDKTNAVTLCSIHKSKGLEAKRVIILNESLIPSQFAKKPSQITQETNLKYVARTRAQEELIFLEADFIL